MSAEDSDEEFLPPVPKEEETAPPSAAEDESKASLTNPDVLTKYQEAAKIAQASLIEIVGKCTAGAKILDICRFGDELIESKCAAIFNKKNKETGKIPLKGVAFPVCVSVNEIVCHCSPLESEAADTYPDLKDGDMVKIDMGVHVDGFIAVSAHTVVVGHDPSKPISGSQADAINATYVAAEVASKMIKAGNTNTMVTKAIKQVADMFDVRPINGTLMHQMKRFVIDGNKVILLREDADQKTKACTFEPLEVYAIDIAMSSGQGKPQDAGNRVTVYKRNVERNYALKQKASRTFFNEVNKKFPTFPFSLRSMPDEQGAKMGIRECATHELLMAYPVLMEKKGDFISHTKFTVLLLPNGNTSVITGLPPMTLDDPNEKKIGLALCNKLVAEKPDVKIPENILELLSQEPPEKKKKDNKKKSTKK